MREQLWLLPSGNPEWPLRATVFRPGDRQPAASFATASSASDQRPVVVINHGTSAASRQAVSLPIYYWLSRWFVERGYIVVLPQRRGYGATGGEFVEGGDNCSRPDHYASGQNAADDIDAVVNYMSERPFVTKGATIVVGISSGGWASLALAARKPKDVRAVVNFAGGRGGHAWGQRSQICGPERLIEAAQKFGAGSTIPTLWLYSSNDSYFGPVVVEAMSAAWTGAGGKAELHMLPPYGDEGHELADGQAGWSLWGPQLQTFLSYEHNGASPLPSSPLPLP